MYLNKNELTTNLQSSAFDKREIKKKNFADSFF